MCEPASEVWVYGYGLLVAVDCASDLPAGAVVAQRKQHPETATLKAFEHLIENTDVTVVLGDSAFDTLEFHDRRVDQQILPVCTYNPRNTADTPGIVFRIEDIVEEHVSTSTAIPSATRSTAESQEFGTTVCVHETGG